MGRDIETALASDTLAVRSSSRMPVTATSVGWQPSLHHNLTCGFKAASDPAGQTFKAASTGEEFLIALQIGRRAVCGLLHWLAWRPRGRGTCLGNCVVAFSGRQLLVPQLRSGILLSRGLCSQASAVAAVQWRWPSGHRLLQAGCSLSVGTAATTQIRTERPDHRSVGAHIQHICTGVCRPLTRRTRRHGEGGATPPHARRLLARLTVPLQHMVHLRSRQFMQVVNA